MYCITDLIPDKPDLITDILDLAFSIINLIPDK